MDFEIKGQSYRSGKMDTFKQFHVSRRLVPVLGGVAGAVSGDTSFDELVQPLMHGIACMTDADCDFILEACLKVVQRQQGNAWSPIYAGANQALMFDDIDMSVMLQIAGKVIQDNLSGFFPGKVADTSPPQATATA
ncbi:hypothetical protein CS053_08430 [Rhodanobacter glycinis]|uniref:Bacteriophage protein n=1 Tax=Rhodanobacter glycinis TaxID=582702 RepID=A0A5B9E0R2_9GAMM|nr:hypothetical protein [Rhodanobacter glycinis]QEE24525.1 hypothetical protein CS053_08430 [Rhodanobacter glycinis]